MVNNIKISIWEIFTFFMSGFVFCGFLFQFIIRGSFDGCELDVEQLIELLNTPFILLLSPFAFIVIGMFLEPIANFLNRLVWFGINKLRNNPKKEQLIGDDELIRTQVLAYFEQEFSLDMKSAFYLAKDYLEVRGIQGLYLTFLARFGFYRNIFFISLLFLILEFSHEHKSPLIIIGLIVLGSVSFARARQFYSYLEPVVFRMFWIDQKLLNGGGEPE